MKILKICLVLFSLCSAQVLYTPSYKAKDQIIKHYAFTLKYDSTYKEASWISYRLSKKQVVTKLVERSNDFQRDPLVLKNFVIPEDYIGSSYDKGHLVPSEDMRWCDTTMTECFYMSNMTPQTASFNRGVWKKLETQVRNWAIQDTLIYITTGPVLKGKLATIGSNKVAVPIYCYKVILCKSRVKGIGFILENKKNDAELKDLAISIDSVESFTKIDFFADLPNNIENEAEKKVDLAFWFRN
jgi:endonuclease G, mitochondrial